MTQDMTKIEVHQILINQNKESFFQAFAPAFCFSKGERSFPMRPEIYIQNVVMAKYTFYTEQILNNIPLSEIEEKELKVIKNYFIVDDQFNSQYANYTNELDFQELIPQKKPLSYLTSSLIIQKYNDYSSRSQVLHPVEEKEFRTLTKYFIDPASCALKEDIQMLFGDNGEIIVTNFNAMPAACISEVNLNLLQIDDENTFLTFNEKMYGYDLGEMVPYAGINPDIIESKEQAPIFVSIIPTSTGAMIKYEYFYALSDAIPIFKSLYKYLPYSITKLCEDFGLHAGDFEGVYVKVDIADDLSNATLHSIQFFGHGRSGSRDVLAENLTYYPDEYSNVRPCVFVGNGTHPSYANNFFGLSKFLDNVGNKHIIVPKSFIDLSPDIESKGELPSYVTTFQRTGNTGWMIDTDTSYVKNEEEFLGMDPTWHQYNPCLLSSIFSCCHEGNIEEYPNIPNINLTGAL